MVYAACDWARCGRTDVLSHDALRALWDAYLPASIGPSDEGYGTALKWATRELEGE